MDIEHAEYSTTSRGDGRIFTREKIREHRTGGGSLLGELAPRTKLVAGGKCPNKLGANGQRSSKELFRGVDQGADDESAESGIGIGVRIRIAVSFLAVVCVFLLPLGTEFGGVHDDRGLFDRLCERRNGLLARGRKRTFIRMFDYISMRATVAGAHDNLIGRAEFA